jgi:DNA-directed RNA polymerase alpha subunit
MKRLQYRDSIRHQAEEREAAKTPPDLPLTELGLNARFTNILAENNIATVEDFFNKLSDGGEDSILELPGIGRKALSDIKKLLRARGYELPVAE